MIQTAANAYHPFTSVRQLRRIPEFAIALENKSIAVAARAASRIRESIACVSASPIGERARLQNPSLSLSAVAIARGAVPVQQRRYKTYA
jgi:predicted metalloenzyme YecM